MTALLGMSAAAVLPKGEDKALIFEASKGTITRMRAGIKPAVEYVETYG